MVKLLERRGVCINAVITGCLYEPEPKENDIGTQDNTAYLHPCLRVPKKEMGEAEKKLGEIARDLPVEGHSGLNYWNWHIFLRRYK